jgi:hypothetical protein
MTTVSVMMLKEEQWEPTLIQVWSLAALALSSREQIANECGFADGIQTSLWMKILNLSKWRLRSHVTLCRTLSYFTHILGKSNFNFREKRKKPQMDKSQPDLRQGRIHASMSRVILPPNLTDAGCRKLQGRSQEGLPDSPRLQDGLAVTVQPSVPRGPCG